MTICNAGKVKFRCGALRHNFFFCGACGAKPNFAAALAAHGQILLQHRAKKALTPGLLAVSFAIVCRAGAYTKYDLQCDLLGTSELFHAAQVPPVQ
jgi:hypothetical protein